MTLSVSAAGAAVAPTLPTQGKNSANGSFEAMLSSLQASTSSGSGASGSGSGSSSQQAPAGSNLNDSAVQAFLKYMKETPAQRFEDEWLAAHHLTEADLKAMSPEKREQIMKEMEQDIKQRIDSKVQQKLTGDPVVT
jgi:hypothetical protein